MVGAGTLAGFGGAQHWAETARRHSLPSHSWQPWPVLSPHWALSTFNKREMQVERRSRPGEGGGGAVVSARVSASSQGHRQNTTPGLKCGDPPL